MLHCLETAKFGFVLRSLIACATNAAFDIYVRAVRACFTVETEKDLPPIFLEKIHRCKNVCASVFQNLNTITLEDFSQSACEIQLIERASARAASLQRFVGSFGFIAQRMWIHALKSEYENEEKRLSSKSGNEETEDDGFKKIPALCKTQNEEEKGALISSIVKKKKIAAEYIIEGSASSSNDDEFRIHVSASSRFTRISSTSFINNYSYY